MWGPRAAHGRLQVQSLGRKHTDTVERRVGVMNVTQDEQGGHSPRSVT